ncbi:succinylglutamate desuccinylase/aspartoacylase family protein [Halostagnicola sp. A-GB9-2]|uniref:succinylglutamate desuccinylase/aspartoacylase family protein n=1 Tax=Halostagnicola sp. A-GB9-2 TaxID=3048066 RepID=UPI0024C01A2F|nr:succinylglutamate desuccinylase/aspartoacylase family protein [Halostagnicola sp. A-GB9-2]MDJ1433185.1 succinylglutamate desuccinylase/aspartoacylase family protein [Halostagnicola sp. A-GB9-2]
MAKNATPSETVSIDSPDKSRTVNPGEKRHLEHEIGENYLSQSVKMPVTVINGDQPGPRLFLSAAVHGNEINGVRVLQRVADRYEPNEIHGVLVCIHVANVPGYEAEERYLPIYDRDLNRSFPGLSSGSEASRMAKAIYDQFIGPCDFGLDFHSSTRNKLALMHARADMDDDGVSRLVDAFGSELVLSGGGSEGSLRREATKDDVPTATIEMGEEDRFQPVLIERAVGGVENVMAAHDMLPETEPESSGFLKVLEDGGEKQWLRADTGGLVEMKWGPHPIVDGGETVCVISDHFTREKRVVEAPYTGLLIGILANPRALPGRPLFHLVKLSEDEREAAKSTFEDIGFQAQRTFHWMGEAGDDIVESTLDAGEEAGEREPEEK